MYQSLINNFDEDIVIIGPTASGKTKLAIYLSIKLGIPIVNCDTRQFWRNITKISCSPAEEERMQAPHLLFNVLEDNEKPSLGYWMRQIMPMEKKIIVGGSFFYPHCLMQGIPQVEISHATKERALQIRNPVEYLREAGINVDPHDCYRVERMLNFFLETGCKFAQFPKKFRRKCKVVCISSEISDLRANISSRILGAIDSWVQECCENQNDNFSSVIGYKECIEYGNGNIKKQELTDTIFLRTLQYSKRQVKFMRRFNADLVVSMKSIQTL